LESFPSHVCEAMKSRGASAPADKYDSSEISEAEEREGRTPLDRLPPARNFSAGVDTAVSLEREVVSGHAYAILTPAAVIGARCGYDKPAYLSVDGVSTRSPGPRRFRAGALVMEACVYGPTR
jgi:hypothetical protein